MKNLKYVAFAACAGLAGLMAYMFLVAGDCAGKLVQDEADCRSHFSADLCRLAFTQADRKARLDFAPFATQDGCHIQYPRCMEHGAVKGFVPVPRSYCIVRTAGGIVGEPIYQKHGSTVTYQ